MKSGWSRQLMVNKWQCTEVVKFAYQESREKLSVFLCRLDKLLHRVFLKGGIDAVGINKAKMEQLV